MAGKEERKKGDPKMRAWLKDWILITFTASPTSSSWRSYTNRRIRTGKSVLIAKLSTPPRKILYGYLSRLTSERSYIHGTAEIIWELTRQTEYVCKLAGAWHGKCVTH